MTEVQNYKKEAAYQIQKNETAFKNLLPKNFNVEKFKSALMIEIGNNPNLAKCNNFIQIVKDVASFGLMPSKLSGQAYIAPYYSKKKGCYEAQLMIGYKGYVVKLEEAGYTIEVELVTHQEVAEDRYREVRGTSTEIYHAPIRSGIRKEANIASAYAIARKKGVDPVITSFSIEEIKEKAKSDKWIKDVNGKSTKVKELQNVWVSTDRSTDFGEMVKKTLIRDLAKKVNCTSANEMSSYEAKRDSLLDVHQ